MWPMYFNCFMHHCPRAIFFDLNYLEIFHNCLQQSFIILPDPGVITPTHKQYRNIIFTLTDKDLPLVTLCCELVCDLISSPDFRPWHSADDENNQSWPWFVVWPLSLVPMISGTKKEFYGLVTGLKSVLPLLFWCYNAHKNIFFYLLHKGIQFRYCFKSSIYFAQRIA